MRGSRVRKMAANIYHSTGRGSPRRLLPPTLAGSPGSNSVGVVNKWAATFVHA